MGSNQCSSVPWEQIISVLVQVLLRLLEEWLKPKPPPAPPKPGRTEEAICRVTSGGAMCTGTVLRLPSHEGELAVLTAAHCVSGVGAGATVTLSNRAEVPMVVRKRDPQADLALLVGTGQQPPAVASVALGQVPAGTAVWHKGFGRDRPGNVEHGRLVSPGSPLSQASFELSVSPGDSGSGIFTEAGELVSVVCCTSGSLTYGASPEQVRAFLGFTAAPEVEYP